jgi:2-dehydropantoate 2-reductase
MNKLRKPLRILSFGAGAIGTYIGGSLAIDGNLVVFLEQPHVIEKLKQNGISLNLSMDKRRQARENFQLNSPLVEFVGSINDALHFGPFDVALFALKSFDTESVLTGLGEDVKKLPAILCLQNGVANEDVISRFVGVENVIHGTVTSAIGRKDIGNIVLEKLRGVGVAAGHPLSGQLVGAMNGAMLNAVLYEDARSMKWSKMLTNLLANASSAILNLTPAQIFNDDDLTKMEIAQIRECLNVMAGQGIRVVDLPGTPVWLLSLAMRLPWWITKPFLQKVVGSGRGAKMPSFHIDLYSGRMKSEVDFLNGAVVKIGRELDIPTPINSVLAGTLKELTSGALPLETFDHAPEKLLGQIQYNANI